jgi:hypothetical protein
MLRIIPSLLEMVPSLIIVRSSRQQTEPPPSSLRRLLRSGEDEIRKRVGSLFQREGMSYSFASAVDEVPCPWPPLRLSSVT